MKRGLSAGFICLLVIGMYFMLQNGKETDIDLQVTGSSFLEDISIVHKRNGETMWKLTAKRADFLEGEDRARLHTIRLAVPENNLTLSADSGIYHFAEHSFAADTLVEAHGENYRILADSLDLDISANGIRTEGRVKVEGDGFSVEGEGMNVDKEQKVKIFRDVKAIFQK